MRVIPLQDITSPSGRWTWYMGQVAQVLKSVGKQWIAEGKAIKDPAGCGCGE